MAKLSKEEANEQLKRMFWLEILYVVLVFIGLVLSNTTEFGKRYLPVSPPEMLFVAFGLIGLVEMKVRILKNYVGLREPGDQ